MSIKKTALCMDMIMRVPQNLLFGQGTIVLHIVDSVLVKYLMESYKYRNVLDVLLIIAVDCQATQ